MGVVEEVSVHLLALTRVCSKLLAFQFVLLLLKEKLDLKCQHGVQAGLAA